MQEHPDAEHGTGLETPFYSDGAMFESIKTEHSILPPELDAQYAALEIAAGKTCANMFGDYLTAEQITYLETNRTVITDHETVLAFMEEWDKDRIRSIDPQDGAIDGVIYTGYGVGDHADETDISAAPAHQLWGGRIALYPLHAEDVSPVDSDLLQSEEAFMQRPDRLERLLEWVNTNSAAGSILHEKVHGLQDARLPLPILEAAAHYYQAQVAQKEGWHDIIENNMGLFAEYYGACIEDLGPDVHRLVFGTLSPEKREAVLASLKERFNTAAIAKLSDAGDLPSEKITWEAEQVA